MPLQEGPVAVAEAEAEPVQEGGAEGPPAQPQVWSLGTLEKAFYVKFAI